MRPQSLTPLFAQVTSLPGIGPRLGKLVEKLAGPLVVDLLWHLPFALVDRRNAPEIAHAKAGEVATANIGSEDFTVTGPTDLPKGTLIKVKDLEGLKLIVEQAEN